MTNPIVELEDVTKLYRQGAQEVAAVAGLSLKIEPGEFTALCGPSGSGKTTTLNLIGALDTATSGQIHVDGRDISKMSRSQLAAIRRDRIGFVFQAYNLIPVLTAYENAELVLALKKVPKAERERRVHEMLEAVGLEGLANRRPDELSGGQQQRVAIARAIVGAPAIVLADEPTANVDSETAESLLDIMVQLNETQHVTFVFSTHDERVMRRARRIVHLRDGMLEREEAKG